VGYRVGPLHATIESLPLRASPMSRAITLDVI
jgi:hypothetical protein